MGDPTKELIIRTLATAAVVGGAAPATRVTDALRTLSPDGMIARTGVWNELESLDYSAQPLTYNPQAGEVAKTRQFPSTSA